MRSGGHGPGRARGGRGGDRQEPAARGAPHRSGGANDQMDGGSMPCRLTRGRPSHASVTSSRGGWGPLGRTRPGSSRSRLDAHLDRAAVTDLTTRSTRMRRRGRSDSPRPRGSAPWRRSQTTIGVTAEAGPVVVAMEDLHWSDPSTLEVLRAAPPGCVGTPARRRGDAPRGRRPGVGRHPRRDPLREGSRRHDPRARATRTRRRT